jgi:hypothetical protein
MYKLVGVPRQDKLQSVHHLQILKDCKLIFLYTVEKDRILVFGMDLLEPWINIMGLSSWR